MESFQTSCCPLFNLAINAQGRGLDFRKFPYGSTFNRSFVRLVGQDGGEVVARDFSRTEEKFLPTGNIPDGEYTLEVYNPVGTRGRFRGYIHGKEAIVRIRGGYPSFCEPWPLRENQSILQRYSRSPQTVRALLRNDENYPCTHPEIRRIASKITAPFSDYYWKILAIHDWVAENVFYDEDSLRIVNGTMASIRRSTLDVLRTRRAVCQGYSDLAVAIFRASGIPAVSINCFALGQGTDGGWDSPVNRVNRSNHAFTAVLMGSRYIFMDITWDSDLVYSRNQYRHKTGYGRTRKYFDMSETLMSTSHRLIY